MRDSARSHPASRQSGKRLALNGSLIASILLSIIDWIAIRRDWVHHPPAVFAVLVAIVIVLLCMRIAVVIPDVLARRIGLWTGIGQIVAFGGLVVALGAGSANWLLGLQGYAILGEGETALLRSDSALQHFENGPLARLDELNVSLTLLGVDLLPKGNSSFDTASRLIVVRADGTHEPITITTGRMASARDLRFFQGVFGFSPRIVVLHGDRVVFDRSVPFFTDRSNGHATSFSGTFEVRKEDLTIRGDIDLGSLDEEMRGHETLRLDVRKNGRMIGHGSLLPGRFATIEEGYRVGFAGLSKWSEVIIARRNYQAEMFAGFAAMLAGLAFWRIAAWRRW